MPLMEEVLSGFKAGMTEQCIIGKLTTICSVFEGTGLVIGTSNEKPLLINRYHFSDTNLATLPSSYILTKGSPLQVSSNISGSNSAMGEGED